MNEHVLNFFMESKSLYDLLEILENICQNLNLDYLNPRIKHFRYFQFTFFGLMVKTKSILEMMLFRAEFLKERYIEFKAIYLDLLKLKKEINTAYDLINKNKMIEGKNKIIEITTKYSRIFDTISNLINKKLYV